ncbi:MAG: hypothetical protein AAB610_00280 [Patescibacteria group bacterium]
MSNKPKVTVTDISEHLDNAALPRKLSARLGLEKQDTRISSVLRGMRKFSTKAYVLEWEGSRSPRGTVLGRIQIGWTQNGVVRTDDSEDVGTYERLIDQGGESGKEHKMLIFIHKP